VSWTSRVRQRQQRTRKKRREARTPPGILAAIRTVRVDWPQKTLGRGDLLIRGSALKNREGECGTGFTPITGSTSSRSKCRTASSTSSVVRSGCVRVQSPSRSGGGRSRPRLVARENSAMKPTHRRGVVGELGGGDAGYGGRAPTLRDAAGVLSRYRGHPTAVDLSGNASAGLDGPTASKGGFPAKGIRVSLPGRALRAALGGYHRRTHVFLVIRPRNPCASPCGKQAQRLSRNLEKTSPRGSRVAGPSEESAFQIHITVIEAG